MKAQIKKFFGSLCSGPEADKTPAAVDDSDIFRLKAKVDEVLARKQYDYYSPKPSQADDAFHQCCLSFGGLDYPIDPELLIGDLVREFIDHQ